MIKYVPRQMGTTHWVVRSFLPKWRPRWGEESQEVNQGVPRARPISSKTWSVPYCHQYFYQYNIEDKKVNLVGVGKASLIGGLTQGKNLPVTIMSNVGGEYVYKTVKGENAGASLVGAALGSAAGWKAGGKAAKGLEDKTSKAVADVVGAIAGSVLGKVVEHEANTQGK